MDPRRRLIIGTPTDSVGVGIQHGACGIKKAAYSTEHAESVGVGTPTDSVRCSYDLSVFHILSVFLS